MEAGAWRRLPRPEERNVLGGSSGKWSPDLLHELDHARLVFNLFVSS